MNANELCAYLCEQYESSGKCGSWQYYFESRQIILSNGLRTMLGLTGNEPISTVYDFMNFIHPDDMGVFNEFVETVREYRDIDREWKLTRADGSVINVRTRVQKRHHNGADLLIGIVWDLSQPEMLSAISVAAEDKLQLTEEITEAGTWEYNMKESRLIMSENMKRLLQVPKDEPVNPAIYEQLAIREDKAIGTSIKESIENGQVPFDKTLRVSVSGELKTIRVKAIEALGRPGWIMGADVDLSPIRVAQQDLRASQKILRQKDNFIRIASHELKTPISSLHGYVQLLLRMKNPEENFMQRSLEAVDRQVMNLNKLLDSLLDVSASEKGNISLRYERFNIYDLIEESVMFLQPSIEHPLLITGETEHWVMADRERINQVLLNLVGNAIKYSPAGKPVTVDVLGDTKTITVSITDNGPGVPDTEKQKIFKRFYRAPDVATRKVHGLGIGLYISAGIIDQHHGRVWVENNPAGGAIFKFMLPKQRWTAGAD